jgi:formate hydrogenlyase subunit 6/NADH:ubiquinone oxidoreductase subunit I
MSLHVNEMVAKNHMFNTECILCGQCRDACPKQVLRVGFCKAINTQAKENVQVTDKI